MTVKDFFRLASTEWEEDEEGVNQICNLLQLVYDRGCWDGAEGEGDERMFPVEVMEWDIEDFIYSLQRFSGTDDEDE